MPGGREEAWEQWAQPRKGSGTRFLAQVPDVSWFAYISSRSLFKIKMPNFLAFLQTSINESKLKINPFQSGLLAW